MDKVQQIDLKLDTSRLFLIAGERVFSYKNTIKEEMLDSIDRLKEWISFFNYTFDDFKVTDFINKTTDIKANNKYLRYFIFEKDTESFVGSIVLQKIDQRLPSCEIGYWVVDSAKGKGYMTEAIQFITRYLVEKHGFVRIEARIDVRNIKSIDTIERCDFEYEGTLKNSELSADGSKLINEALYSITTPVYFK
nr:GNAT family N-acetyltransferase [Mammaliicoccus sp. Marseille-Q6498]